MDLRWAQIRLTSSMKRRYNNTQGKKPSEDGGRDWVDASKKPGNSKDCWQLPEAVGQKACDRCSCITCRKSQP